MNLKKFLEASWLKWLWTMKAEVVALIFGVILFFKLGPWLRLLDPSSAPLDGGVLTMPAVGIVAVLAATILFWILVRVMCPYVDKWFDGDLRRDPSGPISFEGDWRDAGPAVRLCVFFGTFAVVVVGVCIVAAAAFQ